MTERHQLAGPTQPGQRRREPRNVSRHYSLTTVGARLREAREALDVSQAWVADQLGIAQERYSRYETGRTRHPNPEHLVALAKLYGKPAEHFLAMVGFRSGIELVNRLPPEGALVIAAPRPGLAEFVQYVEQLDAGDFAELINTAEYMLSRYPDAD